ncbi:hypothetical protein M9Y10_006990 [Tritrichomonas musculus]|uniref:DUF3447 domain-containing protein n=1 Tax=Tritrichomonas musculus TaxID=1915356 RepID=A0ABR2J174_9EUKA
MEPNEYFAMMSGILNQILEYIDNESDPEIEFHSLSELLIQQEISRNKFLLKELLHLLVKISNNYHRNSGFFSKIQAILSLFKTEILKYYSNFEIFNIFKNNKRLLLYLFKNNILTPDKTIARIISKGKYQTAFYPFYFYKEFKNFFDKKIFNEINQRKSSSKEEEEEEEKQEDNSFFNINYIEKNDELFEIKREIGENDDAICIFIQKGDVKSFISFTQHKIYDLNSFVKPSIFETNPFLLYRNPTLIEYSVFHGSYEIFQYLCFGGVKLTPQLWNYAVHGSDSDLIHYLEYSEIKPREDFIKEAILESVKCHHNLLKDYLQNSLSTITNSFDDEVDMAIIKARNYSLFQQKKLNDFHFFFSFCKYDYLSIVENLLKKEKKYHLSNTRQIILTKKIFLSNEVFNNNLFSYDIS